jgi:hypothetical protein
MLLGFREREAGELAFRLCAIGQVRLAVIRVHSEAVEKQKANASHSGSVVLTSLWRSAPRPFIINHGFERFVIPNDVFSLRAKHREFRIFQSVIWHWWR